jgi:hypothetical protein
MEAGNGLLNALNSTNGESFALIFGIKNGKCAFFKQLSDQCTALCRCFRMCHSEEYVAAAERDESVNMLDKISAKASAIIYL